MGQSLRQGIECHCAAPQHRWKELGYRYFAAISVIHSRATGILCISTTGSFADDGLDRPCWSSRGNWETSRLRRGAPCQALPKDWSQFARAEPRSTITRQHPKVAAFQMLMGPCRSACERASQMLYIDSLDMNRGRSIGPSTRRES